MIEGLDKGTLPFYLLWSLCIPV